MKNTFLLSVLALWVGILTGCGAARPNKFYQLTVPHDSVPGSDPAPVPVTLLVGPIKASPLYREDQIVYTSEAQAMGTYQYQRWAEPPPEMIRDVLLRELRLSGRYRNVYSLGSDVRGDYLLRGQLYDFREIAGKSLLVRVTLEFELRDTRAGTAVWTRYYSHDEPVSGRDITAVVAAMDRDVQGGLREMVAGLDQYFSGLSPAGGAR
jgi:cholesterol transport system auxiliary component